MFTYKYSLFTPDTGPCYPYQHPIYVTLSMFACLALACASSTDAPLLFGQIPVQVTPKPGDAVEVLFSREPDRSGTFHIDELGEVPLPFLGRLRILDLTAGQLRSLLIRRYEQQLPNQTVYVRVLRRVRVLGAVSEPGVYFVDSTMTLADLLAKAGGAREDGNLTAVQISRKGREVTTNIHDAAETVPTLESGDQVFVPRTNWVSRNALGLLTSIITMTGIVVGIVVR